MADPSKILLAVMRGDHDANLGDIADALAQRQTDLHLQQLAASALVAYVELSGISVADVLESLSADEE